MYRTIPIEHILITNKAVYVIETKHLPSDAILTGGSNTKKWYYLKYDNYGKRYIRGETNADNQNQKHVEFIKDLLITRARGNIPVISIVNIDGITDENI